MRACEKFLNLQKRKWPNPAKALAGRDAFRRETFALPREAAREKAREMFRRFPKAAYMTKIRIVARVAR